MFSFHFLYLALAIGGQYFNKFIFSVHLLEIVRRSKDLQNVVNAIIIPRKQIFVTLVLFVLVIYIFTIFIFLFFWDNFVDIDTCKRFDMCMVLIFDNTFKNSYGIINYMKPLDVNEEFYLGGRFWLDNMFAIFLVMLILQMMAGIIIDFFSGLRVSQQIEDEDKNNKCFICGLHKNDLNKLYGNENGFEEHITIDHNYWNYLFCIINILRKKSSNLSGTDLWIYNCFNNESFNWIPDETYFYNKMLEESTGRKNEDIERTGVNYLN